MNIKIDISLCRVCLKQGPGINIYTGNILEKFLFTTLVQVEKNDGLSEIICKKCLARLQIAYDFKKDAIASNRELRSFISNVNKQFQQVTGTNTVDTKSKRKSQKDGESESFDELEEDMQALIDDEQVTEFKDIEIDLPDDTKKEIDRDQLVEILGDNNAITIRKTRSGRTFAVQEDSTDEPPENMEVFLVEEGSEVETGYIVDEYDQNAGELITDETDEPQYLEDDENDDQLYEPETSKSRSTHQKTTRSASSSNQDNRCEVCHKTFSTRTNLTRHRITHEGRKPYVCQICGNAFTQNGSLKSHMFIHTGERPFQCKECGKAFTQSKSLVFHLRRHTGEKPFPCTYCGIKFRQKDGLKRHIAAKHAPDRSKHHVCDICGKVLLSKYSLNMHLNRHSTQELTAHGRSTNKSENSTGNDCISADGVKSEDEKIRGDMGWDELYSCDFCDQAFTNSNDLIEHQESHPEANDDQPMEDSS
ncbi:zinc finger protein 300-like [Sitodiplosis mosellana]|uniref:zinc finger protein 300-like n=1 Tax=Sitodiplosis mosellana TaxID=263140 RepID=UPI002443CDF6|nr:zinc finger protein 300-like [Sitodiplosis mosellana]